MRKMPISSPRPVIREQRKYLSESGYGSSYFGLNDT